MDPITRKKLQSFIFFPGDRIYPDTRAFNQSNRSYTSVCNQSAIKLLTTLLKTFILLAVATIVFIPPFLLSDEIQLPIPVLVPFTDLNSKTGLTINFCYQILVGFMEIMAALAIEVTNCMVKNAIWSISIAICFSIDEFSTILEKKSATTKYHMNSHFRNIIIQTQDLDRYF